MMLRMLLSMLIITMCNCSRINEKRESDDKTNHTQVDTITFNNYYLNGELYLVAESDHNQIIGLDIINDSLYQKLLIPTYNIRTLGSDLFDYYCSNCHSYYPKVKQELLSYRKLDSEILIHGVFRDSIHEGKYLERLGEYEVEAIISYIQGPRSKVSN